jgi:hypothetical protein
VSDRLKPKHRVGVVLMPDSPEPIGEVERARASILGAIQRQDRLAYAEETVQDVLDSLELDGFKIVGRDREQVSGEAEARPDELTPHDCKRLIDFLEAAEVHRAPEAGRSLDAEVEIMAKLRARASRQERPEEPCGFCGGSGYYAAEVGPSRATGPCPECNPEPLPVDREPPQDALAGHEIQEGPNGELHVVREQPAGLREALERIASANAQGPMAKAMQDIAAEALAASPEEGER